MTARKSRPGANGAARPTNRNQDSTPPQTVRLPFVQVPEWILAAPISAQSKMVFCCLASHLNHSRDDMKVWPSLDTIAAEMGLRKTNNIRKWITELEVMGAVVSVQSKTNKSGRHNVYTLSLEPPSNHPWPLRLSDLAGVTPEEGSPLNGGDPHSDGFSAPDNGGAPPKRGDGSPLNEGDGSPLIRGENQTKKNHTNENNTNSPPSAPQGGNALRRPRGLGHASGATPSDPSSEHVHEEPEVRDWRDEHADAETAEDEAPTVVAEFKEGRDEDETAGGPAPSPSSVDEVDPIIADVPAAERARETRAGSSRAVATEPHAAPVHESLILPSPRPGDSLEMARKRAKAERTLGKARRHTEEGDPAQLPQILAGMLRRAKDRDKTAYVVIEDGRTLAEHLMELRDSIPKQCAP